MKHECLNFSLTMESERRRAFVALAFLYVCLTSIYPPAAECANILFYHGVSTYSHRITVWNYIEALVERGHNVSIFQPILHSNKIQHPLVHDFFPEELQEAIFGRPHDEQTMPNEVGHSFLQARLDYGPLWNVWHACIERMPAKSIFICSKLLETPVGQDWIRSSSFDLIIMDGAYNECALGLAHKWNAKVILFATSTLFTWYHEPYAIAPEASWIPDSHVSFPNPMSFPQKVLTTVLPLVLYYNKLWWFYPDLERVLRPGLDAPDMPPLQELEQRVSLMFINSHYSEEFARSIPPFVVPVGGIHLSTKEKSPAPLPADLATFIEKCGLKGFILISFGSAVRIVDAPEELRNVFYAALNATASETCFVWKWEGERPAEMPDNVFTAEWLPQAEILGHPRIKAFMTHGGLMSIQEAIQHAVPMLVVSIFADQDYNSFRIEQHERGIRLEITTLTQEQLTRAIHDIVTDPKYKANMVKTKNLFEDRPHQPVDTAIWWTEYVLRHTHTELSHLKPLSMHQSWYERRMLDVWAFLAVVTFGLAGLTLWGISRISRVVISITLLLAVKSRNKLKSH